MAWKRNGNRVEYFKPNPFAYYSFYYANRRDAIKVHMKLKMIGFYMS